MCVGTRLITDTAQYPHFTAWNARKHTWRPHDLDATHLPLRRASACKSAHPILSSCDDDNLRRARTKVPRISQEATVRRGRRSCSALSGCKKLVTRASSARGTISRSCARTGTAYSVQVVLKGIQNADDARAAMDAHADGIAVSDHVACSWT
jgi:hypothetical protein